MRIAQLARWSTLLLLVMGSGAWTQAQPPKAQTATQFYVGYRAAFDKATKIDDLLPYVSADMRKQVEGTPQADRPKMFEMMKMMGALTAVKVVKEELGANGGAVLTVEGVNSEKKKLTGKVTIVKEGGAWKVGQENWPLG